jgi:hypothetical protein
MIIGCQGLCLYYNLHHKHHGFDTAVDGCLWLAFSAACGSTTDVCHQLDSTNTWFAAEQHTADVMCKQADL